MRPRHTPTSARRQGDRRIQPVLAAENSAVDREPWSCVGDLSDQRWCKGCVSLEIPRRVSKRGDPRRIAVQLLGGPCVPAAFDVVRRSLCSRSELPHTHCTDADRFRRRRPSCPLAGTTALDVGVDTVSVTDPEACAHCGGSLARRRSSTGRPRVYCSDYCRKAAWDQRRQPGAVAVQVKVVERVVVQEHNLAECSRRCCESPVAATNMLYALLQRVEAGELRYGAMCERPWTALQTLIDAVSAKSVVWR